MVITAKDRTLTDILTQSKNVVLTVVPPKWKDGVIIPPDFSTHESNIGLTAHYSLGVLSYHLSETKEGNYLLKVDTDVRFGGNIADSQIPILIENLEEKGYSIESVVREVSR